MNCGIVITKTRSVCSKGANSMSGEKSGAIEMVHLSQYMSTVDATGYYISNYNWFQNFLLQFLEKNA